MSKNLNKTLRLQSEKKEEWMGAVEETDKNKLQRPETALRV